jgi:hypothetical protein
VSACAREVRAARSRWPAPPSRGEEGFFRNAIEVGMEREREGGGEWME